jgi:FecR protein
MSKIFRRNCYRQLSMLAVCAVAVFSVLRTDQAAAQSPNPGCAWEFTANATQTVRCGGLTIIAEEGAQYTLQSDRSGTVAAVDLRSKAVLLDAPKQRPGHRFEVVTPQAIAAVRGTRWAVDTQATTTSVLVIGGRVAVRRPAGQGQVVLGPGEGVDVGPDPGPLIVKKWPQPRVAALLARLGQ